MKSILAAAFVASVLATDANANTGYFTGSGHTITLTKTEQVQLVSEDVTIRPNCGWEPSMDSVDYRCKFVLKNLTAKPLKIQVGFPLDYQILQAAPQAPNPTDLVLNYGFIAREDANTYHVRYVPNDSEEKFSRLFVWDMTFDAAETKILHVVYRLRMSEAISSTRKHLTTQQALPRYEKRWHAALEMCFVEHFHYVTETGKSWAGIIEHATFRVETGLEECLRERPALRSEPPEPQPDQPDWSQPFTIPMKAGAVYHNVSPDGGKYDSDHGTITWEYRNCKPAEPLRFIYYVVAIPRTAADCETWVRHVLGRKPNKTDVAELREIAAAFYGLAPKSASAKKFVEQQIWYHPKDGLRETGLSEEQRAILTKLDSITKEDARP